MSALHPVTDLFVRSCVRAAEADLEMALEPGATTVVPSERRRGSRAAVCYSFADIAFVWCDPVVADQVAHLAGPEVLDIDRFSHLVTPLTEHGVDTNTIRVLIGAAVGGPTPPSTVSTRRLEPSDPHDHALLVDFIAACSADDLDEAEFDLDDLDPDIVVVLENGQIVAQSGARPFVFAPDFNDIGVLTHPDFRQRGLGRLAVAAFLASPSAAERHNLYRYDDVNVGSAAVSVSLGFTVAGRNAGATLAE